MATLAPIGIVLIVAVCPEGLKNVVAKRIVTS
jgi:hypothetical protein